MYKPRCILVLLVVVAVFTGPAQEAMAASITLTSAIAASLGELQVSITAPSTPTLTVSTVGSWQEAQAANATQLQQCYPADWGSPDVAVATVTYATAVAQATYTPGMSYPYSCSSAATVVIDPALNPDALPVAAWAITSYGATYVVTATGDGTITATLPWSSAFTAVGGPPYDVGGDGYVALMAFASPALAAGPWSESVVEFPVGDEEGVSTVTLPGYAAGDEAIIEVGAYARAFAAQPVPVPPTVLLLGSGLIPLAWFRRRRLLVR